jgi:hypothetical protein
MSDGRTNFQSVNLINHLEQEADEPESFDALIAACEKSLKLAGRDHVSTKMAGIKVLLGLMGIMAAIVYLDPAKECAKDSCDDKWFETIIPNLNVRSYIYFLSGFIGYGSTNCTFAFYGPEELVELLANLNKPSKKIAAGVSVGTFIFMQGVQIILTAQETGTHGLDLALSTVGAISGALYGAVGLTNKLKQLPEQLKNTANYIYQHCKSKTNDERLAIARNDYYAQIRNRFNDSIQAKWKQIVAKAATVEIDMDQSPLEFLLAQTNEPKKVSWLNWGMFKAAQLTGSVLSVTLSSTFINLVQRALGNSIDNKLALGLSTMALTANSTYGNFALINGAIHKTYNVVNCVLNGERVDSLLFQLRPVQTSAIIAGSAACAIFSYAFADLGWELMWPSADENKWDNSLQSVGRAMARTSMDIFHFMGPAEVITQVLFRRMLSHGTPREKYLAKLEMTVEYLSSKMPQAEFVNLIETELTTPELTLLKLISWDDFITDLNQLPEAAVKQALAQANLSQYSDDLFPDLEAPASIQTAPGCSSRTISFN